MDEAVDLHSYRNKKLMERWKRLYDWFWWRIRPGTVIHVRWPAGPIIKTFEDQYRSDNELFSSDPNEHYRPWLEEYVGKQGVDWDWKLTNDDMMTNRLTIKIRNGKDEYASLLSLMWK